MCLAQYREAASDLAEALEFFRTVHADELAGYDGESVRQIVDTLRASRPHLYPPMSAAVFAYNATLIRNLSLPVQVVRPPGNWSDESPIVSDGSSAAATTTTTTAAAAGDQQGRRLGAAVNRIGRQSDVTDDGVGPDGVRLRRGAAGAAEALERRRSSSIRWWRTSAGYNEVIGSDDVGVVVVQNNEQDRTTSGHDFDEDWTTSDGALEVPQAAVTAVQVLDAVTALGNHSSGVDVNATLNMTLFPPPPDRKYVDTLFKIAHIFHFVGIGILAVFVLQVTVSIMYREKQK